MIQAINRDLMKMLAEVAHSLGMHSRHGDPWQPVSVDPLLDQVTHYYTWMPKDYKSWLLRWFEGNEIRADIALNITLKRLDRSADRRDAIAHEWAHIVCNHQGTRFEYFWKDPSKPSFHEYVHNIQERQCYYVSSFLLIQARVLLEGRGECDSVIARKIDVPIHLMPYRWYIWRKFKM